MKPDQVSTLGALLGEAYDVGKLRPDDRYLSPVPWWHGAGRIDAKRRDAD
jgi:hypothetical protein